MVNVNAPLPFNLNNTAHSDKQSRISRLRTRSPQPSLDTERQSLASSASASPSHELDEEMRWPTLNVRIVRGGSALARGRPITRDAVAHQLGSEGGEAGAVAMVAQQSAGVRVTAESYDLLHCRSHVCPHNSRCFFFFFFFVTLSSCLWLHTMAGCGGNRGGCSGTCHPFQNPKCWIAFAELGRLKLSMEHEHAARNFFSFVFDIIIYHIIHLSSPPPLAISFSDTSLSSYSSVFTRIKSSMNRL